MIHGEGVDEETRKECEASAGEETDVGGAVFDQGLGLCIEHYVIGGEIVDVGFLLRDGIEKGDGEGWENDAYKYASLSREEKVRLQAVFTDTEYTSPDNEEEDDWEEPEVLEEGEDINENAGNDDTGEEETVDGEERS